MDTIYKLGEGKLARRIAFYSSLILVAWGFKEFATWAQRWDWASNPLLGGFEVPGYRLPMSLSVIIGLVGTVVIGFVIFRLFNRPTSADLLIDTETEMKKVHWPSMAEARQATFIVLLFVAFVALYLTGIEYVLKTLFQWVLSIGA